MVSQIPVGLRSPASNCLGISYSIAVAFVLPPISHAHVQAAGDYNMLYGVPEMHEASGEAYSRSAVLSGSILSRPVCVSA